MAKTIVEEHVSDPNNMRLFQQSRAVLEAAENLAQLMEEKGVSRTELARRLGRSKSWVTQMLDGRSNKTLRTIADAFAVLGQEYHSSHRPIQIAGASCDRIKAAARELRS